MVEESESERVSGRVRENTRERKGCERSKRIDESQRARTREISNKRPGYEHRGRKEKKRKEKQATCDTLAYARIKRTTNRYECNTIHIYTRTHACSHTHTHAHAKRNDEKRQKRETTERFTHVARNLRTNKKKKFHGFERQRALLYTYVNEMIILYYKT